MRLASRALLAMLLLVGPLASAPSRSHADTAGKPWSGPVGFHRSVADLMRTQTEAEEPEGETEAEVIQPDRTHLPQNPAAPQVSQTPAPPVGQGLKRPGVEPFSPQVVGTSFLGAQLAGTHSTAAFPPDVMGAVGPTQYVVAVNNRIVTYNKTTGVADAVLNLSTNTFFGTVRAGSGTSDPRIRYDRLSGRWFIIIINVSTPNRILIAVSDAASAGVISATTVFTYFFIPIDSTPPTISPTCLADYPTLGIDANALYVGTNNFCGSPQLFNSTDGYVIRKSSVLGAGPIVVTVFRGLVANSAASGPYTPQGVDNYDPAATEGYFIGVDAQTYGTLQLRRVATPGGTPTISSDVTITVPTTGPPITVPHSGNTGGTNGKLDGLDDRLFAAHIRNGHLWTAQNIAVNNTGTVSGTTTRNGSRWYDLLVPPGSGAPTLVESGTVFAASAGNTTDQRNYWIPSIMVSGQGHAALGFSTAGSAEFINAGTVGRLASDPLGTTQTPFLYTSSSAAYNPTGDSGAGRGARRWGDYSYTSLDPLDDQTMWTIQEWCTTVNNYGVQVAKLIAPPPAAPSALADVPAGVSNFAVTLTGVSSAGSGFYDPGADLPGVPAYHHVGVAITAGSATGTPPTVVSATYVTPTSLNLVLNSVGASGNLPGEKYTLTVTNPDGQTASGAIVHVTASTTVSIAGTVTANEGNAGLTPLSFAVTLSQSAAQDVTVHYATANGTATLADNDYQAASGTATITAGQLGTTIPVNGVGDTKREADETFTVTLDSPTNAALGNAVSTATLTNDDAAPTAAVDSVTHAEGNAGTTTFTFTVRLSAASGLPASVDYSTFDGTATSAGNDYLDTSGTLNFPAGTVSRTLDVSVVGDGTHEPDETFTLGLTDATGATIAAASGLGTIQNDDGVPGLSIDDVSHAEGQSGTTAYAFTVTLSNASDQTVTVGFATADGSATVADGDYTTAGGTLNFAPGTLTAPLTVLVNGDIRNEPDEAFAVRLSSPSNATITDSSGTGTVLNDDDAVLPIAQVLSPNGGEALQVGSVATLQWSASDNIGVTAVDLVLSRDGGATYPEVLAAGLANTGSFDWTVTGPAAPAPNQFLMVRAHDAAGNVGEDASDAGFAITDAATAVHSGTPVTAFALGAIVPNPSFGTTRIGFELPREAEVRLSVVDLQGREVAVLAEGVHPPGRFEATWAGHSARGTVSAGMYFVRYRTPARSFVKRLVLTH